MILISYNQTKKPISSIRTFLFGSGEWIAHLRPAGLIRMNHRRFDTTYHYHKKPRALHEVFFVVAASGFEPQYLNQYKNCNCQIWLNNHHFSTFCILDYQREKGDYYHFNNQSVVKSVVKKSLSKYPLKGIVNHLCRPCSVALLFMTVCCKTVKRLAMSPNRLNQFFWNVLSDRKECVPQFIRRFFGNLIKYPLSIPVTKIYALDRTFPIWGRKKCIRLYTGRQEHFALCPNL